MVTVGDVPVGLAICFDVIYDEVIAESVTAGAELLVFQTNNADFRGTDENLQQLAVARIRAVETGRTVVNVSTVGTSQIIRPDGSTLTGLPAGQAGAMIADTDLRAGITPAVLIGQGVSTVTCGVGWVVSPSPVRSPGGDAPCRGLTRHARQTTRGYPAGGRTRRRISAAIRSGSVAGM
jgi:apolipoprotein N-acyltransferase